MNKLVPLTNQLYRAARFVALAALLLASVHAARVHAITINMEYTDEGDPLPHDENPSWDPGGVILKAHFEAAKDIWETLLPGSGTYSFDFHWDNDIGELGLYTSGVDDYIEINPLFNWFADPSLDNNFEFELASTLYSQLTPGQQSSWFPGTTPPAGLEAGYRSTDANNAPSASMQPGVTASNGYDLLTVALHEIGHALGLSGTEPGEFNIDPQHVGGITNVLVAEDPEDGHLAGDGDALWLMGDGLPPGERRLPSAADVLVIAEDQGIADVYLARVGRINSGPWSNAVAWIGGDQPSIPQEAYITHGGTVTLDVPAWVAKLLVAPGNSLQVQSQNLRVEGAFTFAGAAVSVGSGGSILAGSIVGDTSTLTTAAGSQVAFNSFAPATGSTATSANFNGSVAIGYNTPLGSTVTFDPETLATWTIGQQLGIGALLTNTALLINNGADFTSGSGVVGYQTGQGHVTITGLGSTWTMSGPLTGNHGSITVRNAGNLTSGDAVLGNDIGGMEVTVDYSFWEVNGDLTIGPAASVGSTQRGRVVVREAAQVHVDGDLEIRSAAGFQSEVVVEKQGLLGVDGGICVRMHGALRYLDNTSSNNETIDNYGNTAGGNTGGRTIFSNTASASNATIRNHGAGAHASFGSAPAGATHFLDSSDAGSANITNRADGSVSTFVNGHTVFYGSSSASFATIENEGSPSQSKMPGRTEFRNSSRAGDATINSRAFVTIGDQAGRTIFYDSSSAENADLNLYGGYSDDGRLEFHQSSTAANATIVAHNIPTVVGRPNNGGKIIFYDNTTAAQSQITLRQNGSASQLNFYNNSTAASAQIVTEDGAGQIAFFNNSTAANANIALGRGSVNSFYDTTTAASATYTLAHGAQLFFQNNSSAGQAQITAAGSSVYPISGAAVTFNSTSLINNTTVTLHGGTASLATGATASYINGAHAGNSTIIAHGGSNGGTGAEIRFNNAFGDTARLVVNSGATVDLQNQAFYGPIEFGSIEGTGRFVLRGAHMTVGNRNTTTTVSGPITDNPNANPFYSGGRVTKVGAGTLTLAGVNTYSGFTTINSGTVSVTGSIAGGAIVNNGGTLNGTGTIVGGVTINAGGVFAPGLSPGTLTVDGLAMMPGGILNFELGNPARDHILLTNNGNISLDGILNISLLGNFTPTLGQSFPLFEGAVGTVTGAFDSVIAPTFNGLTFDVVQTANTVSLKVGEASFLDGDFDFDGDVDGRDFLAWQRNPSIGNLTDWQANYGASSLVAANVAVPEPGSLVLMTLLCATVVVRREHAHRA